MRPLRERTSAAGKRRLDGHPGFEVRAVDPLGKQTARQKIQLVAGRKIVGMERV